MIDASAAVEYLLRTPLGQLAASTIEAADLIAPELVDAQVLSVIRRAWLQRKISTARARAALDDLADWPMRRLAHAPLLSTAWTFRHNVNGYDALYLAAGQLYGAPVLTADGPLARVVGTGVAVKNIRS